MSTTFKYASVNEATIYESVTPTGKGKKPINKILMGTYVKLIDEKDDWYKVNTAGPDGWMHKDQLGDNMGLKIFYLDVGQGDGALIEIGNYKILIDAGPSDNMFNYLTKWQYKYLLDANKKIHIDYLIVSHFDQDHYKGFIKILEHTGFTFGQICHAGILKFASRENTYSTGLGDTMQKGGATYLTKIFDDLLNVSEQVPFNRDVTAFMNALNKAKAENRVQKARRMGQGDTIIKKNVEGKLFQLEVLAPFREKVSNKNVYVYWADEGKTINGHSLVVKITFGDRTFLFGGDLNSLSENYLIEKYEAQNPFEADVAKSCHHGSSDFTEKFMALINPYASVISSGDNESFAHPRADAVGCAGKYSKSQRPLVFSTELARSTDLKNKKILYGMINCRCNGEKIYMSQMKEASANTDLWDSYEIIPV
ncbi:MAG TPA: MBL fold metallo-hydrolase [Parafilimonas sp.]|nr:MBL fold metallo-hydrolase [Parafilimonas sp.]